jgi:hypothetical protein
VVLLLCVPEISGSDYGQETNYPEQGFSSFFSIPPGSNLGKFTNYPNCDLSWFSSNYAGKFWDIRSN